jgi:hypothetical protein
MPTMLPDTMAGPWHQRRLTFTRLTPAVVVAFYLSLLVWNAATLESGFRSLFGNQHRQGEYNPMEPSRPIADRRAAAPGAR